MAGGDFDGDLNQVSFNPHLVQFLKKTQAAVGAVNMQNYLNTVALNAAWNSPAPEWDGPNRPRQYQNHCSKASTIGLRGIVCAKAERAGNMVLQNPSQLSWDNFFKFAIVSQRATDAPKKYAITSVLQVTKELIGQVRLGERHTDVAREQMTIPIPALVHKRPDLLFQNYEELLLQHFGPGRLGQVLLPRPGPVILGAQAGKDLRHALITGRPRGSVTTSPL